MASHWQNLLSHALHLHYGTQHFLVLPHLHCKPVIQMPSKDQLRLTILPLLPKVLVKTPTILCLLMFPGIFPTLKDMLSDNQRRCGARALLRKSLHSFKQYFNKVCLLLSRIRGRKHASSGSSCWELVRCLWCYCTVFSLLCYCINIFCSQLFIMVFFNHWSSHLILS